MMAGRFRSSKFRHVYGAPYRREHTFENIRITRNTHDSNFCSVNLKYVAVVLESSGGGAFAVLDINRPGRVDINCPKVCGHSGAIMDIKWSPFNDNVIASASDDATVKLWTIPSNGISGIFTDWSADLHGHSRKVAYLEWHTTAANILMSVGYDYKVMIWNVEQAEPVTSLTCHRDTVFSVSWGQDGKLIASTCKDKKIRIMDPRTNQVAMETNGHESAKPSKVVFAGENYIFTTGFNRTSNRQYALWDVRQAGKPLCLEDLDCSSGTVLPYMDLDNSVVYLAGKGDGLIRYFEIVPDSQAVHFLNAYQSHLPQRGLAMMPKRGVDTSKNELTRFFKLHASKNLVEPISMIVPRKAEGFQSDIYPPTASIIPSCTADEWTSGVNRGPILLNLEDGTILDKPKSSMSPAVQPQMGVLPKPAQITTYKSMPSSVQNRASATTTTVPQPSNHRLSSHTSEPTAAPDSSGLTNGNEAYSSQVPASIKNIHRLSMTNKDIDNLTQSSSQPAVSSSQPSSTDPTPNSNHSSRPMSVSKATNLFNGFSEQNQNQTDHKSNMAATISGSPPMTQSAQRSKRFGRAGVQRSQTVGESSSDHISAIKFVLAQAGAASQSSAPERSHDPAPQPYSYNINNVSSINNNNSIAAASPGYNDSNDNYNTATTSNVMYNNNNNAWRSPPPVVRSNTVGGESSSEHVSAAKLVLGQSDSSSQPNNYHVQMTTSAPALPSSPPSGSPATYRSKRLVRYSQLRSKTEGGTGSDHVSAIKLVLQRASATVRASTQPTQAIHVRKVWAPPVAVNSPSFKQADTASPGTDPELKKAYFRQLEEIRSLQEQIQLKDRRIKLLESELSQMKEREADLKPGESNC